MTEKELALNRAALGSIEEAVPEWVKDEKQSNIQISDSLLRLSVSTHLTFRRIYLHVGVSLTTPDDNYWVNGEVQLLLNERPVANLPACVARDLGAGHTEVLNQSLENLWANNSTAPDALEVELAKNYNTDGAILTPLRLNCRIDGLRYRVKGYGVETGAITQFRVWLGCLSNTTF